MWLLKSQLTKRYLCVQFIYLLVIIFNLILNIFRMSLTNSHHILMINVNGHHTLWRCEDVNNRGQQLQDLILKNDLILFNHKSHTYFHSASGTFTSIDLTLSSPSLFLDFSWKVGPDPCGSDHFVILLENDGPPSLERNKDGS